MGVAGIQWFSGQMMSKMMSEEILFRIVDDLFNKQDFKNPYTTDQFDIDAAKLEDDVLIYKGSMAC